MFKKKYKRKNVFSLEFVLVLLLIRFLVFYFFCVFLIFFKMLMEKIDINLVDSNFKYILCIIYMCNLLFF